MYHWIICTIISNYRWVIGKEICTWSKALYLASTCDVLSTHMVAHVGDSHQTWWMWSPPQPCTHLGYCMWLRELYAYNPSLAYKSPLHMVVWDCLGVPNYCNILALELSTRVERSSLLVLAPCNQYFNASNREGNANWGMQVREREVRGSYYD